MKYTVLWIALCSVAIYDARGARIQSDDVNYVQGSNPEDQNGKQRNHLQDKTTFLGPRFQGSVQGRNNTEPAPLDLSVQDRTQAPSSSPDFLLHASESEGKLTMDFLAETSKLTSDDFVLSPFGIWGIVSMIFSAADGKTAQELSTLLKTDSTSSSRIEAAYKAAYETVNFQSDSVKSSVLNVAVTNKAEKINKPFLSHYHQVFKTKLFTVDTANKQSAADDINQWAASSTQQRIRKIVQPADFIGLKVLLASATFFKGRWQQPFNISATSPDAFKDENDAIIVSNVPMMRMRSTLKYGFNTKLECQTLELPYADGITSMVVFLPRRKVKLQNVLENMRGASLAELIPDMSEEEVDVSLPRFSTQFRANLNQIFVNLNAGRMHNEDAELPRISNNTYVSKIFHIAEIETTEEGTIASSVTGALVSYKTSATNFQANRPFVYFINHIPSRLVLFAGKISKPSSG